MQVICFHNPDKDNGYLSNWWYSNFTMDGHKFTSAEQYLMFKKAELFGDVIIANKILETHNVKTIKNLGKRVRQFDKSIWNEHKLSILYKGLKAKFEQNSDLLQKLLATHDNLLADCALNDTIWGIGIKMNSKAAQDPYNWNGLNLLGKTLMEVRESFQENHQVKNFETTLKDYLKERMSLDAKINIIGCVWCDNDSGAPYNKCARPFRVYIPDIDTTFRETYTLGAPHPDYEYDITEDYEIYHKDSTDDMDFFGLYYSFQDMIKDFTEQYQITISEFLNYKCLVKFDKAT